MIINPLQIIAIELGMGTVAIAINFFIITAVLGL
jgi:hypothetical protein